MAGRTTVGAPGRNKAHRAGREPGGDRAFRLVRLLHLASPALPVGAYTYSQGLEWAVEDGTVQLISAEEFERHTEALFARLGIQRPVHAA